LRTRRRIIIAALTLAATSTSGCDRRGGAHDAQPLQRPRQALGADGPLRVEIALDATEITTAQRLRLSLTLRIRSGWRAEVGDIAKALPDYWKITEDHSEPGAVNEKDPWRETRRAVIIEPFLDGEATIAPIEFTATSDAGADEAPVVLRSEPMNLRVRSVLAGETDQNLAPVKSVVEPAEIARWWPWGAAAVAVALASALLWWFAARRRRGRTVEPTRAAAHTIALNRLDSLLASGLLEKGAFKPFYIAASHILRRYIEDRFALHAPLWTTEELLDAARLSLALAGDDVKAIERFTRACDEVKFAAATATRTQAEATSQAVREFVQRTRSDAAMVLVQPEPVFIPAHDGGEAP